MSPARGAVRIGNCSGFYGDRHSAMREMLTGGDLDFLTGDYLAELTMLILARDRAKSADRGYAKTFLTQLEESLGLALDRGVRIVANAGGLNPAGLADAVRALAQRLGLTVDVAHVEGDDLVARADELGFGAATGTGAAPAATSGSGAAPAATSGSGAAPAATSGSGSVLAANAYLGAWGIVDCLNSGADVVVTGRVTDASVIVGPAAAHHGWGRADYDRLAGAVAAGHVIECGAQATGGNYAFFTELDDLTCPGFPIAEISADGSSVITKHPGTGGAVTVGTVTAQLLYEITGPRYANPDATLRVDSIELCDDGPDRVRISGVRGEPPPPTLKVSLNSIGGFRNEMTLVLTGLDIEAKAELVRRQLETALPVKPAELEWTLARTDHTDADTEETASALLRCVVRDSDPAKVGREFSSAAVELALASYPGFHATSPPGQGQVYGVFRPAFVAADEVPHVAVHADGSRVEIPPAADTLELAPVPPSALPEPLAFGATVRAPLGRIAGARSGDKGGSANVGVWVRTEQQWRWLAHTLTIEKLRELLPETTDLPVARYLLPNLRAVNFVIEGILGEGVAYQARFDPQAKAIGEWLRSRHIDIPEELLA
ncbi:exopolyphosphatase [Mycolicibacterium sp. GF69]|uniref:acyclic terpene utilization AtuA family protein n=1 Tax=Mycolicibacterium sp. GF69 TaxID=2267251 RepID=UPI000DCB32AB|nr:acyclic terpene utilization AtuA family protein [Mycolicibacterium sp. GF69]RAV11024.1 exopolyphosphatase [Mycolicibacterium sp. GF69]